jgi:adenylate kinase
LIWLIFGAPGSGKGTQSYLLSEKYGLKHLSTGDMFRKNLKEETELGREAKSYMDKGNLVPDVLVTSMVAQELAGKKDQDFILDGFPRTIDQAEGLDKICEKEGMEIKGVLYLKVPDEDIIKRLSGRRVCESCGAVYHVESKPESKPGVCDVCSGNVIQRKDDTPEVIENRLDVYKKSTEPLMAYYNEKGLINEVDGLGDTQDVFKRLEGVLG